MIKCTDHITELFKNSSVFHVYKYAKAVRIELSEKERNGIEMDKKDNGLSALLRTNPSAHAFYTNLPYDKKQMLINSRNRIRNIVDMQNIVEKAR